MRKRVAVWAVVTVFIVSAALISFQVNRQGDTSQSIGTGAGGDAGPMSVSSIDLINQTEGLLTYEIAFDGAYQKGELESLNCPSLPVSALCNSLMGSWYCMCSVW